MEQSNFTQSQYPIYTLKPVISRIIISKALIVVPLAILLYVGAYLNFKFIGMQIDTIINMSVIFVIFLLVAFDLIIEYRKALKLEYYFYQDRLYANGQWIMYAQIQHVDAKRTVLDNITHTCDLVLDGKTKMRYVPDAYNIYQYIQNLFAQGRNSQQNLNVNASNANTGQ